MKEEIELIGIPLGYVPLKEVEITYINPKEELRISHGVIVDINDLLDFIDLALDYKYFIVGIRIRDRKNEKENKDNS